MDSPVAVIVDASSFLYRAFHALPPLTNPSGMPTGAVRGFTNMLNQICNRWADAQVLVVFDKSGTSFRNDIYPEYKANRASMPEDLRVQIEPIYRFVRARGLPLLTIAEVEADDVIATLAVRFAKEGGKVLIASSDKDLMQVVSADIHLYDSMKGVITDLQGVSERYGVGPDKMAHYQALVGDSADNIPGVRGVGPKLASAWLSEYGDLDGVLNAINQAAIKGAKAQAVLDSHESGELDVMATLTRMRTDVAIEDDLLQERAEDTEALAEFYTEMGFREGRVAPKTSDKKVQYLDSEAEVKEAVANLPEADELVLLALPEDEAEPGMALAKLAVGAGDQVLIAPADLATVLLKAVCGDKRFESLVVPGLKDSMHLLGVSEAELPLERCEDPLLLSYIEDASGRTHTCGALAKALGCAEEYEEIVGKGVRRKNLSSLDRDSLGKVVSQRLDSQSRACSEFGPKVSQDEGLRHIYREIEMPLSPVLMRMELVGVAIDGDALRTQSKRLGESVDRLRQRAWDEAGMEFNPDSPAQLRDVLFTHLQLPMLGKRTAKGHQPSTAEPVLQELAGRADAHPLPATILEYRNLHKLKSTYTDSLPELINPATGRLHTHWGQRVAATGRLSSLRPNLQNIPIRNEEGRKVREAIVAPPGEKLICADYSQIELRIMAHLSQDAGLISAFEAGADIHSATAAEIFGLPIDQVDAESRRSAKAINFGLIYGMSAHGLAQSIKCSFEEATAYIELYFSRYPGVRDYMNRTRAAVSTDGEVRSLFGRRLVVDPSRFQRRGGKAAAERVAINAPMQGTAADIIKIAMLGVDSWIQSGKTKAKLIMQVHDELVLQAPDKEVAQVEAAVIQIMEGAAALRVPLTVSVGTGQNWDAAASH